MWTSDGRDCDRINVPKYLRALYCLIQLHMRMYIQHKYTYVGFSNNRTIYDPQMERLNDHITYSGLGKDGCVTSNFP